MSNCYLTVECYHRRITFISSLSVLEDIKSIWLLVMKIAVILQIFWALKDWNTYFKDSLNEIDSQGLFNIELNYIHEGNKSKLFFLYTEWYFVFLWDGCSHISYFQSPPKFHSKTEIAFPIKKVQYPFIATVFISITIGFFNLYLYSPWIL